MVSHVCCDDICMYLCVCMYVVMVCVVAVRDREGGTALGLTDWLTGLLSLVDGSNLAMYQNCRIP